MQHNHICKYNYYAFVFQFTCPRSGHCIPQSCKSTGYLNFNSPAITDNKEIDSLFDSVMQGSVTVTTIVSIRVMKSGVLQ